MTARPIRPIAPGREITTGREVTIDVAEECDAWQLLDDAAVICRGAALAALDAAVPALGDIELSIVLDDDALLRQLNHRWRDKDAPTNVLSFPAQDFTAVLPAPPPGAALPLGDVVLAHTTIAGEAAEQGKTLGDHLAHLVVHGVLHLVGFDHEETEAAEQMEQLERAVLASIGIADPYREIDGDGPAASNRTSSDRTSSDRAGTARG